jgi:nucleoside-diphosphate-sugar epimerase
MTSPIPRWLERLIRGTVDFLCVQIAGILALAFSASYVAKSQIPEVELSHYYFRTFLPLSLVFPLVYALTGLYTKLRGYALRHKLRRAALGASIATLLLVFVSFLANRVLLPRSAALVFATLAIVTAVGVRWLKDRLFHNEDIFDPLPQQPIVNGNSEGTVLVLGGAGYIGSIVVSKLLDRGMRVRLLDRLVYGDQAIAPFLNHPRLEFIAGDCRNISDVVGAMNGAMHVIHLAAIVGDPACAADDENAYQINYAATRMILEVAKGVGIQRFIFASSCSVYGASESIMDEKSETAPISLYAETKLQSEQVLLEAASRNFHPTILRFATVFGLAPRPRFDLVVNLLTAKAIQDGVITIYNGGQWRPFIHVQDIAEAVVQTLCAPVESVSGEIFNVGDDRMNFTLAEIAEKIRAQIPLTQIEYVENSDRRNYRVSFQKIRNCIGFTAQQTVENGIAEIRHAFERGEIADYRRPFYSNVSYLKERGLVHPKNELDVKVMAAFSSGGTFEILKSRAASSSN